MFILFGWGKQTLKKHGPVFKNHCDRCNNEELWQLYTRRTWFTLFFIPVIPYSTEHLVACPVCSFGAVITEAKFKELKAIAEGNIDSVNKKLDEDEHKNKVNQVLKEKSNNYNVNGSFELSGKTETQINYLRQMEEIRRAKEEAARVDNTPDKKSNLEGKDNSVS